MDLGLTGCGALVTGASRGLGRAIARLGREGCQTLHLAARDRAGLDAVAAEIAEETGASCTAHAVDLTRESEVQALWDRCGASVDLLINNAGAVPGGSLEEVDAATWRAAWDLKVFGYINLMRAAYADMAIRGQGVIVNVLGTAGREVPGRYVAGVSGNAALAALTGALGGVSLDAGVRIVGVSPGDVINERGILFLRRQAEASLGDPERWREMLKDEPGRRGVYEDDIADAVLFLASSRAAYISGVNVPVDGGLQTRQRVL